MIIQVIVIKCCRIHVCDVWHAIESVHYILAQSKGEGRCCSIFNSVGGENTLIFFIVFSLVVCAASILFRHHICIFEAELGIECLEGKSIVIGVMGIKYEVACLIVSPSFSIFVEADGEV